MLSILAENLIGSEILRLNQVVTEKINNGETIYNLTIGDFNPEYFPIPEYLAQLIKAAYDNGETNYPPADGVRELKTALLGYLKQTQNLEFNSNELMVAGGGRPLIYAIFKAIVDPNDTVLYPVPSWNNNHYCFLSGANGIAIETLAAHGFLPTLGELKPYLNDANLLCLCSPSNPTGTMFDFDQLKDIVDAVVEENNVRLQQQRKPLYVMYDQIYSALHKKIYLHIDPISINPAIRPYVIYVDGISKSIAATGLRLGWAMGSAPIISKMKTILGHIGAWAPKPEQVACATFFKEPLEYGYAFTEMNEHVDKRSKHIYDGISMLKSIGLPIDVIIPQGAIYLSVQFPIKGMKTKDGKLIQTTSDISDFLLDEAHIAVIPFTAFGCKDGTDWFRFSVGTINTGDIDLMTAGIEQALASLGDSARSDQ